MKPIVFTTVVAAIAIAFTLCYALPQSYQVNINFIPALVSGSCSVGQFWSPRNMTCTMCFCLTGRVSRCVPQPGCSPNQNATSTTTAPPTTLPIDVMGSSVSTSTIATLQSSTASSTARPAVKVRRHVKFGAALPLEQGDDNY